MNKTEVEIFEMELTVSINRLKAIVAIRRDELCSLGIRNKIKTVLEQWCVNAGNYFISGEMRISCRDERNMVTYNGVQVYVSEDVTLFGEFQEVITKYVPGPITWEMELNKIYCSAAKKIEGFEAATAKIEEIIELEELAMSLGVDIL